MQIFISWHGPVSKAVAGALHGWLPCVIQEVEPFLSSEDIHKGDIWFGEVSARLDSSAIGILCLTPENLNAPWIHFEAGALSKQVGQKRVIPFLLGVVPGALKPPLSNFQAVLPSKEDVLRLMQTVNEALGERRLADERLRKAFEKWWPELEKSMIGGKALLEEEVVHEPERTPHDILMEILELVRGLAQRGRTPSTSYLGGLLSAPESQSGLFDYLLRDHLARMAMEPDKHFDLDGLRKLGGKPPEKEG